MDIKNMAAVESTRTSSVLKKQNEKHEKFLGGFFYFLPFHLQKLKGGSAERGERE